LADLRPRRFPLEKGAFEPGPFDGRPRQSEGEIIMQAVGATNLTLAGALWPATRESGAARALILMLLGTVALWLSAKIQVPLVPVPITMQTLVVLTLGIAYGWKLGGATLLLYLAEGAAGLPVFAGGWGEGGGYQHLYGPTAGYLVGFVIAAAFCGWLAEHGWDRSARRALVAMLIGNVIIYLFGLPWLAHLIGWADAVTYGLMPFIVGDALKIGLGGCLLPIAWRLVGRRGA
jgi:biotin transport system substrate-specific component